MVRAVIWLPGLAVAIGAAAATAHGLYEVAIAARVPAGIAWLYPLITDGLALVAYGATARLRGGAARYAWAVVVLAAGLSGLAQAAYLAGDATLAAPPALRFGVGAWPAVAAAVVAHLLYLLAAEPHPATAGRAAERSETPTAPDRVPARPLASSDSPASGRTPTPPDTAAGPDTPPDTVSGRTPDTPVPPPAEDSVSGRHATPACPVSDRGGESPVRDRARAAAERHATRHGALPTVRQLMDLAGVSRGTAADALKTLRQQPTSLHLVPDTPDSTDREARP